MYSIIHADLSLRSFWLWSCGIIQNLNRTGRRNSFLKYFSVTDHFKKNKKTDELVDILIMNMAYIVLLKFAHILWIIMLATWTFRKQILLKCESFIRNEICEQQWGESGRKLGSSRTTVQVCLRRRRQGRMEGRVKPSQTVGYL